MLKSKITLEHLSALRDVIFPIRLQKNREGSRKTILVQEVLDILKKEIIKSDSEIAASFQNLTKCDPVEEWVASSGEVFQWTPKGFLATGGYKWQAPINPEYCACTYPEQSGISIQGHSMCSKCKKLIL